MLRVYISLGKQTLHLYYNNNNISLALQYQGFSLYYYAHLIGILLFIYFRALWRSCLMVHLAGAMKCLMAGLPTPLHTFLTIKIIGFKSLPLYCQLGFLLLNCTLVVEIQLELMLSPSLPEHLELTTQLEPYYGQYRSITSIYFLPDRHIFLRDIYILVKSLLLLLVVSSESPAKIGGFSMAGKTSQMDTPLCSQVREQFFLKIFFYGF